MQARIRTKLAPGSLRDKAWWSTLKSATGSSRESSIPLLICSSGRQCHSSQEKSECFAEYFSPKCSLGYEDLRAVDLPALMAPDYPPLFNVRFRVQIVMQHLVRLDPSKAAGPDGITGKVLKECCRELAEPVARLYSHSFCCGIVPTMWKLASVLPVCKKPPNSNPCNYRPASLLSILSKIIEAIVNSQLDSFLDRHHLLPDSQYGFRQGRCTPDVLTALQLEWTQTVANGGTVPVIAVDIGGAFDRVSHSGIIHKLQQAGATGFLIAWLRDYVADRNIQVAIGGKISAQHSIRAGDPQGSVLGPTHVADIDKCLVSDTRLSSFADDTMVYSLALSNDLREKVAALQQTLDNLHDLGRKWRIRFEPAESQLLVISKARPKTSTPSHHVWRYSFAVAEYLKLLRVTFDSNLAFRHHLHRVSTRAKQRLSFLHRAVRVQDHQGRIAAHKGFIRPVLEYAPLAWMGAAKSHLDRLDRIQRSAPHILGPGILLQSLRIRRTVAALPYL